MSVYAPSGESPVHALPHQVAHDDRNAVELYGWGVEGGILTGFGGWSQQPATHDVATANAGINGAGPYSVSLERNLQQ